MPYYPVSSIRRATQRICPAQISLSGAAITRLSSYAPLHRGNYVQRSKQRQPSSGERREP